MAKLLKVGTRILHQFGTRGHGRGTIIGYNGTPPISEYATSHRGREAFIEGTQHGLINVGSFYDGVAYPYRIRFDSGYEDVYARTDFSTRGRRGRSHDSPGTAEEIGHHGQQESGIKGIRSNDCRTRGPL